MHFLCILYFNRVYEREGNIFFKSNKQIEKMIVKELFQEILFKNKSILSDRTSVTETLPFFHAVCDIGRVAVK